MLLNIYMKNTANISSPEISHTLLLNFTFYSHERLNYHQSTRY